MSIDTRGPAKDGFRPLALAVKEQACMKQLRIKSGLRSGGYGNHNSSRLKVKSRVRSGGMPNHNVARIR